MDWTRVRLSAGWTGCSPSRRWPATDPARPGPVVNQRAQTGIQQQLDMGWYLPQGREDFQPQSLRSMRREQVWSLTL